MKYPPFTYLHDFRGLDFEKRVHMEEPRSNVIADIVDT